MVVRMALTKARINLGQVVRRVLLNKDYFILEKDGIPVAGVMGAEEMEDYLETMDPVVRGHIDKSNREYLAGKAFPAETLLKGWSTPRSRTRRRRKA